MFVWKLIIETAKGGELIYVRNYPKRIKSYKKCSVNLNVDYTFEQPALRKLKLGRR